VRVVPPPPARDEDPAGGAGDCGGRQLSAVSVSVAV
jgi:hypothetical protein